ncbi:MAG: helix-turn-helix domain-containing protein [Rhizobiaceae bacterium]|nr:helix-turn-helix domain-containing protein [Rhizobiaceae bacterium]
MDLHHATAHLPAPSRLDLASELEAQAIQSPLDRAEWTLHGRRNRIFVLQSGGGKVSHSGEDTTLAAPCLVWIPEGNMALLTLHAGARGAWMALSTAAMGEIPLPAHVAQELGRLADQTRLGTKLENRTARRLCEMLATMEYELREREPGAHDMIRHLLALIGVLLWRSSDLVPSDPQPAPRVIVGNFLQMIDLQMRQHWSVADYARYLGVSTDRLNTAVQRATGRTPLAVIHARLTLAACQMLESSGLQISEIASLLGFEDAAYFSRFFKRMAGKSPRQYRTAAAQRQLPMTNSFAAWP